MSALKRKLEEIDVVRDAKNKQSLVLDIPNPFGEFRDQYFEDFVVALENDLVTYARENKSPFKLILFDYGFPVTTKLECFKTRSWKTFCEWLNNVVFVNFGNFFPFYLKMNDPKHIQSANNPNPTPIDQNYKDRVHRIQTFMADVGKIISQIWDRKYPDIQLRESNSQHSFEITITWSR